MLRALLASAILLHAASCEGGLPSEFPDAEVGRWDTLAPEELERLWQDAQPSGGVLAVEPYTAVVGTRAARKKTCGWLPRCAW